MRVDGGIGVLSKVLFNGFYAPILTIRPQALAKISRVRCLGHRVWG